MSATLAKDYVTVEDYLALPDGEWQKWELSDGQLIPRYGDEMSARMIHNVVRDRATRHLGNYLDEHRIGICVAEQDFELVEGVVRRPDLALLLGSKADVLSENPAVVSVAPDLVVEVVSPSKRADDVEHKIGQLLASGCQAVWVIYHKLRKAIVCTSDGRQEVSASGALEAPDLLPGFRLKLEDLFERASVAQ